MTTLQIKDYARALDSAVHVLVHGDRDQQIRAAEYARGILIAGGHRVRKSTALHFKVTARTADGTDSWSAIAPSSMDALLDAHARYEGTPVAITVRHAGGAA